MMSMSGVEPVEGIGCVLDKLAGWSVVSFRGKWPSDEMKTTERAFGLASLGLRLPVVVASFLSSSA